MPPSVISVYFYIAQDPADAPTECSIVREPWGELDADSPPAPHAAADLAKRVLGSKGGRWGHVNGFTFQQQGVLKTPWGRGKWGILPDKPGFLFADFGGARHELNFGSWPGFVSTRCSDGDIVKGEMITT